MNIVDEEFVQTKKEVKPKNTTKKLLIAIIIVSIMIIVMMCLIVGLKKEPLKIVLDGNNNSQLKSVLVIKDGVTTIPIRDMATILKYENKNGDYLNKSEDVDKCYVEIGEEVVNFVANSNKIEKINMQTRESTFVTIDEPVQLVDGKLYTTPEGFMQGFNAFYSYNEKANKISIQTMSYIVEAYKQKAIELGYKGIAESFNDSKTCLKNLIIVIDAKGKYGLYNLEKGEVVLETKYDKISYIPDSNEFLISSNGKIGIKEADGKDKMKIQYQEINLISQSTKLYVVKKDDRYGVVDAAEDTVIPIFFDEIGINVKNFESNNIKNKYLILDELIPVKRNGKWGLYDINGNQICKTEYDDLGCKVSSNKNIKSVLVIPDYEIIIGRKEKGYYLISKSGIELGNGMAFEKVYLETELDETNYIVGRNGATANIEKIIDKLLEMTDGLNSNSVNKPNNDDEQEDEEQQSDENEGESQSNEQENEDNEE